MAAFARYFAIVPAAGESVRMGRPKLTIPWRGRPLIEHVLDAWKASRVDATVVVVRPDDHELAELVHAAGGHVVMPILPPPDMRASVAFALGEIRRLWNPTAYDAVLVAPADLPRLSPVVINRLIDEHASSTEAALVPMAQERRGHPVLFPWHWTPRIRHLDPDEGLNALLRDGHTRSIDCSDLLPDTSNFDDIDTPEDLGKLPL